MTAERTRSESRGRLFSRLSSHRVVGIPLFLRTVRESTLFSFTLKPPPPILPARRGDDA